MEPTLQRLKISDSFKIKNFEDFKKGLTQKGFYMETGEHITSETAKEIEESGEIENLKKVEAALFLSARFLSLNDLVMLTDINPLMLRELIEKLGEKYNADDSAIEIIAKENMWKMDVKQEYVSMINKLATGSAEFSKAEQETLAVIAYKQPVKQSVIINIRGNKAYDHVKHFIDIGLVMGKRVGHTKELRLSDEFFEYFHLQKKGDGTTEIIPVEGEVIDNDKDNSEEKKEFISDASKGKNSESKSEDEGRIVDDAEDNLDNKESTDSGEDDGDDKKDVEEWKKEEVIEGG